VFFERFFGGVISRTTDISDSEPAPASGAVAAMLFVFGEGVLVKDDLCVFFFSSSSADSIFLVVIGFLGVDCFFAGNTSASTSSESESTFALLFETLFGGAFAFGGVLDFFLGASLSSESRVNSSLSSKSDTCFFDPRLALPFFPFFGASLSSEFDVKSSLSSESETCFFDFRALPFLPFFFALPFFFGASLSSESPNEDSSSLSDICASLESSIPSSDGVAAFFCLFLGGAFAGGEARFLLCFAGGAGFFGGGSVGLAAVAASSAFISSC